MKSKLIIALVIFSTFLSAKSLWTENSSSPFLKQSSYKIGDAITVEIDENLSALQSGSTKANKSSNVGFGLGAKSDSSSDINGRSLSSETDDNFDLSSVGRSRYTGKGSTSRKSAINTVLTATIIDIQPNGNVFILGQRQIKINEEVEQIELSGIVRIKDISEDNTVLSSQIANVKISVSGVGVVTNPQKPGMFTRMFDWMF